MDAQDMHSILEEKINLEKALTFYKDQLMGAQAEKEQINKMYQDLKHHTGTLKSQSSNYQNKLVEEMTQKKMQNEEHEERINQLRRQLDYKEKEIEKMNQKLQLPVDHDILRMRVQKDLENRYRFELDQKTQELDQVNEIYFENKRLYETAKAQLESAKIEFQKVLSDAKRRHQEEIQEFTAQNHVLQIRIEDSTKDKEVVRQIKRDFDDLKRRLGESQQECIELRKERDQLKIEKNDLIMKNAKDIEDERNSRRVLQTENDKLKFQIKCLEDDLNQVQLKCERKAHEVQGILGEKTSLLTVMKEKEIMIDSIRRQLAQTKEDLHLKEQELDAHQLRSVAEDKDKSLIERKEKTRIHKELETLERNFIELQQQRKGDVALKQAEIEILNKQLVQTEENGQKLSRQVENQEQQLREIKKKLVLKSDQCEVLEKEYAKMQERYRDSQNLEFNLSTAKIQQEAALKLQEEQVQKLQQRFHEEEESWKQERTSNQKQIQELFLQLDRNRREQSGQLQEQKQKCLEYKQKVKAANLQIQTLANRLAKSELQNQ